MTMKFFKRFNTATVIFMALFILLCLYGLATDCPDTAGYVYCSAPERWELLH
jgi:hypothetical protein